MEIGELCKLEPGYKVRTSKDLFVDDEDEIMPDNIYTIGKIIYEVSKIGTRYPIKEVKRFMRSKHKLKNAYIILKEFPFVHYSHECFN